MRAGGFIIYRQPDCEEPGTGQNSLKSFTPAVRAGRDPGDGDMRKATIVSLLAAGVAASAGSGCRGLRNRHDEPCAATSLQPPPCGPNCATVSGPGYAPVTGFPASMATGSPVPVTLGDCPGGNCGPSFTGSVSAVPTSFGGPIYPVGNPVPLRPATGSAPANELPYPTIPSTNLPEAPAVAPTPMAVPPASARTTADPRPGK